MKVQVQAIHRQYLETHKKRKNTDSSCINSHGNKVCRRQLQEPPLSPFLFQNHQALYPVLFFSKNLSTSQFRINIIEMNKVSNTTHNSLGLVPRIFPPIFLYTVGRYLRNLLIIFSQLCMFRQNSEKKYSNLKCSNYSKMHLQLTFFQSPAMRNNKNSMHFFKFGC